MKKTVKLLFVVAGVSVVASAAAQFAKPEDAVKYRQSAMFLMGQNAGRINAQLKTDKPNVQVIQTSAALIETLSKVPYEAFLPGTDLVANTKAKPEIFKDTARFNQLAESMQGEVVKLNAAAKGGDVTAIRTAFGGVGKACKACHDDFQAK